MESTPCKLSEGAIFYRSFSIACLEGVQSSVYIQHLVATLRTLTTAAYDNAVLPLEHTLTRRSNFILR